MGPDGSVSMSCIFAACPSFQQAMFYNLTVPIRTVLTMSPVTRVTADSSRLTVRLLSLSERLCAASEEFMAQVLPNEATLLGELLATPAVQAILAEGAASSCEGSSTRLLEALSTSDLLEVACDDSSSFHAVKMRPDRLLRKVAEDVFEWDAKVRSTLRREGEVALKMLLQHPQVRRALARGPIQGAEPELEVMRTAFDSSTKYELDGPRLCVRVRAHGDAEPTLPAATVADALSPVAETAAVSGVTRWPMAEVHAVASSRITLPAGTGGTAMAVCAADGPTKPRNPRLVPTEKDARLLRQLLAHYFE